MSQYQITAIVGNLGKDPFNLKSANALAKSWPPDFSFRQ
jgi:hypothetical protein